MNANVTLLCETRAAPGFIVLVVNGSVHCYSEFDGSSFLLQDTLAKYYSVENVRRETWNMLWMTRMEKQLHPRHYEGEPKDHRPIMVEQGSFLLGLGATKTEWVVYLQASVEDDNDVEHDTSMILVITPDAEEAAAHFLRAMDSLGSEWSEYVV